MAPPPEKVLGDIGKRLSEPLSKDPLLKLLKKAGNVLSELSQSSSLQHALAPLNESLVQKKLLQHKDKDIRILLAVCFCEVIRILAPAPPFSDEILKGIFKLIINTFAELSDMENVYFGSRVKILETVAALKCCVLMLDIGCENLVTEMFNIFFSAIRDDHQQNVRQAMLSIMTSILEEKVSKHILDVILRNLLNEGKGGSYGSFKLAVSLVENCTESLGPPICAFLASCVAEKDASGNELKEFYHEIIFQIYQYAPQMLFTVLPNLTLELLTDQVDVRIKSVHLIGRILVHSRLQLASECRPLFIEFLKRFSDKSAEVRSSTVDCAKTCYLANSSRPEAREILTALEGRLLDFDDKIRIQSVSVICDLGQINMEHFPSELILEASDRVRDKKVSVRKRAAIKLLELYHAYCAKFSEGLIPLTDHFEQIPSKIFTLCLDKDCKEFSLQKMELVLADELFPSSLSTKERVQHWIALFSFFTLPHCKTLHSILTQKQRFQSEMRSYLALREKRKTNSSEELEESISDCFKKMALSFVDSVKAEECFRKLHQMKDNNIFRALLEILCHPSSSNLRKNQEAFLKIAGDKNANYEFFRVLSLKCAYSIFTQEHVVGILEDLLLRKDAREQYLETPTFDLLCCIACIFPLLLRGSEDKFLQLFPMEVDQMNEKLLQMVTKVGSHISIKFSEIYPFLEPACLEGTRTQSKEAISSMAALMSDSDESNPDKLIFDNLCQKLLRLLRRGQHVPTVLQSVGCISQHYFSSFQLHSDEITKYILQRIILSKEVTSSERKVVGMETCSTSCKLKIYGLKTLVRSCLPLRGSHGQNQIRGLLDILTRILNDEISDVVSSEIDEDYLRLAAAVSTVRLSSRWDLHIPPRLFNLSMALAKDPSPEISKSFLCKVNKLLKYQAIPKKYAIAFALGCSSESSPETQSDASSYLGEFFRNYNQNIKSLPEDGVALTTIPAYIIVYLIHVLAHDPDFPSVYSGDESNLATFISPFVALLNTSINPDLYSGSNVDVNDIASYLRGIFSAVKRAVDAVDFQFTPKLHRLSEIGLRALQGMTGNSSSSPSSRFVFLPSSLYKATDGASRPKEEAKLDEDSIDRLLRAQSSISKPAVSLPRSNGRKMEKDGSTAGKRREKEGSARETGGKRKKAETIQSCSETRRVKEEHSGEGSSMDPIAL